MGKDVTDASVRELNNYMYMSLINGGGWNKCLVKLCQSRICGHGHVG